MSQSAASARADNNVNSYAYQEYLGHGEDALARLLSHPDVRNDPGMKGRTTCAIYSCPIDLPRNAIVWHTLGGVIIPQDERDKHFAHAFEQAHRLAKYHYLMLSYQCRNAAYTQWGGAVRGLRAFHSASGLTEDLNELLSLLTAHLARDLLLPDLRRYLDLRKERESLLHDSERTRVPLQENAHARILYDLTSV